MQPSVMVEEVAKHYTGAQEMVQKHKLLEADITGQSDRINSVLADAQKFAAMRSADTREGTNDAGCFHEWAGLNTEENAVLAVTQ